MTFYGIIHYLIAIQLVGAIHERERSVFGEVNCSYIFGSGLFGFSYMIIIRYIIVNSNQ